MPGYSPWRSSIVRVWEHVYDKADSVQEIRIYPGADASFTLYEDEGNNYNYEHGAYCNIKFRWDNGTHTLTIEDRQGEYRTSTYRPPSY